MKLKVDFAFEPEERITTCVIFDQALNKRFCGVAMCHEDDIDMMNEYTGEEIAYQRALIEYLKDHIDNELKPQLAALKQLYYSMNRSKHFNEKSYEAKMLFRQINLKEEDIKTTKRILNLYKSTLKNYIKDKEKFYQLTRRRRAKKEN